MAAQNIPGMIHDSWEAGKQTQFIVKLQPPLTLFLSCIHPQYYLPLISGSS